MTFITLHRTYDLASVRINLAAIACYQSDAKDRDLTYLTFIGSSTSSIHVEESIEEIEKIIDTALGY